MAIAGVVALGVLAQWLAWRFRLPSILLLLAFGFAVGPVTGVLDPAWLQGEWVFAFVSLSIGVILFEGGLTLRISELSEVGRSVLNLVTLGVVVTWVGATLGLHYLVGFDFALAVLGGAILTVTGPTVVVPLLRHVRPNGRVGTVAKWEGITIDPVGAILAVLVLDAIIYMKEHDAAGATESALLYTAEGLFTEAVVGVGVSVIGAVVLTFLMRRGLLPDHLQNALALGVVVIAFAVSNMLQHEAGLVTTTLMGVIMANQSYVPVRRLAEFKEDLQVILIASLFIVLSARLEMSALEAIDAGALLFLGALIFLVRPLAVGASLWGTQLNWKEWAFLSWLAPRGIVAAAVAALFAFRLEGLFPPEQVEALVPIIFLVIVGTVATYGLTLAPVAQWLGLAQPDPQGVIIVGAHAWARRLAGALQTLGFEVLVVDSNAQDVHLAHEEGLPAKRAHILSESVIDELDLAGMGRLLALTPSDEINALATLHFSEVFESTEVYQIATRSEAPPRRPSAAHGGAHGAAPAPAVHDASGPLPRHLRGRPLFGSAATFATLSERFAEGDEIYTFALSDAHPYEEVTAYYEERARREAEGKSGGAAAVRFLPLFLKRDDDRLIVFSGEGSPNPQPGDTLLALAAAPGDDAPWHDGAAEAAPAEAAPAEPAEPPASHRSPDDTAFEALVARAPVFDLGEEATYEAAAERVAEALAEHLEVPAEAVAQEYRPDALGEHVVTTRGVALLHFRMRGIEAPALALVRSRSGLRLPVGADRARAEAEAEGAEAEGDGSARVYVAEPNNGAELDAAEAGGAAESGAPEKDEAGEEAPRVHALFFLVSPEADSNSHLRLGSRIGRERFIEAWRDAEGEEELRRVVARHDEAALAASRPGSAAAAPEEGGAPSVSPGD